MLFRILMLRKLFYDVVGQYEWETFSRGMLQQFIFMLISVPETKLYITE